MASSQSGASLVALYRDALAALKQFDDGLICARDQGFAESLNSLIAKFKECLALIEAHSIFSSNEEVDDVATAHLKYVKTASALHSTANEQCVRQAIRRRPVRLSFD